MVPFWIERRGGGVFRHLEGRRGGGSPCSVSEDLVLAFKVGVISWSEATT